MDLTVVTQLGNAGIDTTFKQDLLMLGIEVDDRGRIQPVGNDVVVFAGPSTTRVTLKKISELFAGAKTPPSFRNGPTDDYLLFFAFIELAVIEFCRCADRPEYDAEIERLYTLLRRRPDGRDGNVLFSYMQAAARLYMSAFDVSQAELDAVARRLSQSAGRFADGPTSTTYCEVVGAGFREPGTRLAYATS
ncbi:hypothetical protein BH11MYX4_BH11MYX4_05370 [soil metagenome]